jgi:hypothetical protein
MFISTELQGQVQLLISQKRKIDAVKLIVDTIHCSLKEAKEFADNYILTNHRYPLNKLMPNYYHYYRKGKN